MPTSSKHTRHTNHAVFGKTVLVAIDQNTARMPATDVQPAHDTCLRTHVIGGSNSAAGLLFGGVNGQAEIPQHQLAICLKKDVFWLDVAVNDASDMQGFQHMQQRGDHLQAMQSWVLKGVSGLGGLGRMPVGHWRHMSLMPKNCMPIPAWPCHAPSLMDAACALTAANQELADKKAYRSTKGLLIAALPLFQALVQVATQARLELQAKMLGSVCNAEELHDAIHSARTK